MIFRQYLDISPVAASYLFGCGGKGVAAVVDPLGDLNRYILDAKRLGMEIKYVFDTHLHADHLSIGRELARATKADYVLQADVVTGFDFRPVRDGEVLPLGNDAITVWHTPGHTPEHISLLVADKTRADEPWLAFTGHTLMVGDLGRTELASNAEEGARALFQSARRLMSLPDYVEVYPGAFSGSVCGRSLSGKPASTIGFERRHNAAMAFTDESAFVAHMVKEVPPRPENAEANRAANSGLNPGIGKPVGPASEASSRG
jgi:glyoxylase-like metal-dependent hydrolase (beta-lactamase superfamily II)